MLPQMLTVFFLNAAAMCMAPLSCAMTLRAWRMSDALPSRSYRPVGDPYEMTNLFNDRRAPVRDLQAELQRLLNETRA